MRVAASFAATLVSLVLVSAGTAGKAEIGASMPEFSNLQTADGKTISSADLANKDVVVLVLTCNHCPVAKAYEDRLIAFASKHATPDAKVALVALSVNNMEADLLPAMTERAKDKGFNFPYAHDPSQKIAKDLGATKTPECFVFGKDRKLAYYGAIDNNMNAEEVTASYMEDAVKALMAGKAPKVSKKAAMGCGIKFDN